MRIGVDTAGSVTATRLATILKQMRARRPADADEGLVALEFWGRYLVRVSGKCDALAAQEVELLHAAGMRILLIYSGTQQKELNGTRSAGAAGADVAANAATVLGAPGTTAIYLDVEANTRLSSEFLTGWAEQIAARAFCPGIYCAPLDRTSSAGFFACSAAVQESLSLFTAQPCIHAGANSDAVCSVPTLPPTFADALGLTDGTRSKKPDIWQRVEDCYGGSYDIDLATEAGFDRMWSPR